MIDYFPAVCDLCTMKLLEITKKLVVAEKLRSNTTYLKTLQQPEELALRKNGVRIEC